MISRPTNDLRTNGSASQGESSSMAAVPSASRSTGMPVSAVPFCCPGCGAAELVLEKRCTRVELRTDVLDCSCDRSESDEAGTRYTFEWWSCVVRKPVLANDTVDVDSWEEPDFDHLIDESEDSTDVICAPCVDKASDDEWQCQDRDEQDGERDTTYSLECGKCANEIEFEWHGDPDYDEVVRILPVSVERGSSV